ncbi:hypothetical protein SAMN05518801_107206 [Novosphingobium sp. CF614]|uniref:hypothetical protein n=1 Tax=Novosphingobium sp. CF614 TaxID=1884364 RepID=UPI0008E49FED|nr:hypothetical protein [Novosphingobium sp. CF614]SFG11579.1 hypothetical protein SAMN05518801_107206 [Novosphingobium sp. CF614]
MTELDTVLAAMRARPVPGGLEGIDEAVLTGLATLRDRQASLRSVSLACVVAGLVGLWTGVGTHPGDTRSADPLLGLPAAAPSSLLVD